MSFHVKHINRLIVDANLKIARNYQSVMIVRHTLIAIKINFVTHVFDERESIVDIDLKIYYQCNRTLLMLMKRKSKTTMNVVNAKTIKEIATTLNYAIDILNIRSRYAITYVEKKL